MSNTQVTTDNSIATRLQKLAQLYQQQQASELMTRTLDKLLQYEMALSRMQLEQLQQDMQQFEQEYSLSSAEFYRRFQAGQTDDRMDYVEWASIVQMARNLQERLQLLSSD